MVTRRETAQLRAAAHDRYLRFGLIGVPGRYSRPVTSQLEGRPFPDLPGDEATRVVEGLALLQWPKSGVVALLALPFAILAHLPPAASTVGLAIIFAIMFVSPAYMLIVAVVYQLMKRHSRRSNKPASNYPRLLTTLLAAPYVVIVAAAAGGIALR